MPLSEEQLGQFPESVRDWDEVKNSDTPENVWDRLGNMRKKFGTALFAPTEEGGSEGKKKFLDKAIELSDGGLIPRPDMEDEEQRDALFTALGRPKEAAGYEFAEIEGSEIGDDRKKFLGDVAHELGLSKSQLKGLDQKLRSAELQGTNESQEAFTAGLKELRQEWGLVHDDRVNQAKKIAEIFFPHLDKDTPFSAAELKAFHSIAKQLGTKNKEIVDHENNDPNLISPNEAEDQINEIRANAKHPYFDRLAPGHKQAKAKMSRLYKIKNGLAVD